MTESLHKSLFHQIPSYGKGCETVVFMPFGQLAGTVVTNGSRQHIPLLITVIDASHERLHGCFGSFRPRLLQDRTKLYSIVSQSHGDAFGWCCRAIIAIFQHFVNTGCLHIVLTERFVESKDWGTLQCNIIRLRFASAYFRSRTVVHYLIVEIAWSPAIGLVWKQGRKFQEIPKLIFTRDSNIKHGSRVIIYKLLGISYRIERSRPYTARLRIAAFAFGIINLLGGRPLQCRTDSLFIFTFLWFVIGSKGVQYKAQTLVGLYLKIWAESIFPEIRIQDNPLLVDISPCQKIGYAFFSTTHTDVVRVGYGFSEYFILPIGSFS